MSRSSAQRSGDLFAPVAASALFDPRCDLCPADGAYGLGWPASPVQRWFCRDHLPADFFARAT